MFPSASTPPRLDIDAGSTDEEVVLFLGERRAGDPVPSNVIIEVNPFSLEPWDSPEGRWYLYNSKDAQFCNEESIFKTTKIGYWRSIGDLTILNNNVTSGRKTTLEFYIGEEPFGNKTGWMMYEYHKIQKGCQGISNTEDYSSICRVFWQENQMDSCDLKALDGEHYSLVSSDANNSEDIESMLLHFLEQDQSSSPTVMRQSQVGTEELKEPELSNSSRQNRLTISSAGDILPPFQFSSEDYLALEDLYDAESTSSSSANSSLMSSISDDGFDAGALFRVLEDESNLNMLLEHENHKSSPSTFAKPCHTLIIPSNSAASTSAKPSHALIIPSNSGESISSDASTRRWCEPNSSAPSSHIRSHPKRTHSGSSASSSNSNGSGSKSVRRIARLGKKYCCFGPF